MREEIRLGNGHTIARWPLGHPRMRWFIRDAKTRSSGDQIACSATWEGSSTQGGSVGPATIQCKLSPCRDDCKGSLRAVKTWLSKDLMREVISGE